MTRSREIHLAARPSVVPQPSDANVGRMLVHVGIDA
jgi:hypothetical protein